jgi:transcriptional regulator GlxA family with amidase domain
MIAAMAAAATRRVAILVFRGVQSLDVTGPLEVLAGANALIDATRRSDPCYEIALVAADARPLRSSSGLQLVPDATVEQLHGGLDTLIVAGGQGARRAAGDDALLDWIRQASARSRRTVSVCTGAFLLARAGLLDGRRATTHWASAERLAREHPAIAVDAGPIFVRDGQIWTSAGVTAGMDLTLALVEQDLDRDAALTIARHLVLFLRRPGNQAQFSAALAREPLREALRAVVDDVAGDHSVEAMATRAHMSPRHFAREFRAETGLTPARYVAGLRLEAARRRLEDTDEPIAAIAGACGFGTAESMRRSFLRALGVAPAEYRRRFQPEREAA